MSQGKIMFWALYMSSAVGTAILAFEMLKMWGSS